MSFTTKEAFEAQQEKEQVAALVEAISRKAQTSGYVFQDARYYRCPMCKAQFDSKIWTKEEELAYHAKNPEIGVSKF